MSQTPSWFKQRRFLHVERLCCEDVVMEPVLPVPHELCDWQIKLHFFFWDSGKGDRRNLAKKMEYILSPIVLVQGLTSQKLIS